MPLAPEVTVIHEVLLDAVHEQVLLVETLIDAVAPPRPSRRVVGETEYEHTSGACVTVKVWPAIVKVPVRPPLVFGNTTYRTLPLPVPDALPRIVIHDALLAAVHAQPLGVETVTSPVSPSPGALALAGEIEYEHEAGGGGDGGCGDGDGEGGCGLLPAACVTVGL